MIKKFNLSFVILALCANCLASIGDTSEVSLKKYGSPVGKMKSSNTLTLIYKTNYGQLKETYNNKGICIESLPKHNKAKIQTLKRAEASNRFTQRLKQADREFQNSLTRLDKELKQADKEAEQTAQAFGIITLGWIIGSIIIFALVTALIIFAIKHMHSQSKRADKLTEAVTNIANTAADRIQTDPQQKTTVTNHETYQHPDTRYMPKT